MLILHRMAQLGVMTQKPVNIDLVSRPYPILVVEQAYQSNVSMILLRKIRREIQGHEAYTPVVGMLSISKRNIVKRLGIHGGEAYTPAVGMLSISKRSIVKRLGIQGGEAYTPAVEMISLVKKDIVVTNFSDDKTGYIGSAKMLSIVKKRG